MLKNLRPRNSRIIGVTIMKRELDAYLNSEEPIWNGVEKNPGKLLHAYIL
jgi:hypothetical protein